MLNYTCSGCTRTPFVCINILGNEFTSKNVCSNKIFLKSTVDSWLFFSTLSFLFTFAAVIFCMCDFIF